MRMDIAHHYMDLLCRSSEKNAAFVIFGNFHCHQFREILLRISLITSLFAHIVPFIFYLDVILFRFCRNIGPCTDILAFGNIVYHIFSVYIEYFRVIHFKICFNINHQQWIDDMKRKAERRERWE